MSYILEALKKLEEKREQEDTPRLFIFSRASRAERRKRSLWPYLLAAALLVNAVVMTWWVSERHGEKGAVVAEKAPLTGETAVSAPVGPLAGRLSPPAEKPTKKRETHAAQAPQEAKSPAPATRMEAAPAPVQSAQTAAATPPKEEAPVAAKVVEKERPQVEAHGSEEKHKRTEGRVQQVNELPGAVQSALPEFRISGHAYSAEPQTRVVRINEKILQEGQELSPGLRLEEIVPQGVVFSYQGYRFWIDLNGNR